MKHSRPVRYLLITLLAIWSLVTIAAMAGMFKLWWDRERVQYLGKTTSEQRAVVWRNAGLAEGLLNVAGKVQSSWPKDTSYSAVGDHNQLSYLKYLLIPRLPAGSDTYSIDANGSYTPVNVLDAQRAQERNRFPVSGLVFSFLAVCGMTLVLQKVTARIPFSPPEMFDCISLLVMGCIVVSRSALANADPAFYLLAFAIAFSWILLGILKLRGGKFFPRFSPECGCQTGDSRGSSNRTLPNIFLFGCIGLSVIWVVLMSVIVVPDDWDAWAIWAAKAKVLALGNGPLADVGYFGHSDYPLLWPSIWAFSGWLGGGWEEMWSRGWSGIFFLLCIWEIVIIIERHTGRRDLGMLGGHFSPRCP